MEKRMIDGVYTIEGIDSTSQLVAFYKEVVDKNIEKYVGITTQGIKFKLDNTGERAVQLKPNEEYALNPMYRKIEVEPIDEIIENLEQPQEVAVESIEQVIEVVEQKEEITVSEEPQVAVAAEPTNTVSYEEFEQLQIENAQLADKCATLTQEKNLHKERADAAELREEQLKQHVAELTTEKDSQIEQLNKELETHRQHVCSVNLSLDETLEYIKSLGYEAFIRKI